MLPFSNSGTTLNIDNMIKQLEKKKDDGEPSTSTPKVTSGK